MVSVAEERLATLLGAPEEVELVDDEGSADIPAAEALPEFVDPEPPALPVPGELPADAAALAALAPGPGLDAALAALGAPAGLSDAAVLEAVAATERVIAALHATQATLLAEFATRGPQFSREFAVEELAARMRWTTWTAGHRLTEARHLTRRLPATLGLLAAGEIDYPRARKIVAGTEHLDEAAAAAVDAAVAGDAAELTTAALAARVAAEAIAVDPAAAEQRARRARAARRVAVTPLGDGMARLTADGPAEDIHTLMQGLTRAADQPTGPGDDRGIDARRFDTLCDYGRALLAGAPAPTPAGDWRPAVLLTIDLPTFLGLTQHPAHLAGHGPIPAGIARAIAAGGTLRRILTDPFTGTVLGLDGHTYPGLNPDDDDPDDPDDDDDDGGGGGGDTPPPPGDHAARRDPPGDHLRGAGRYRPRRLVDRLVRLRDATCTAPGCRRTAWRCDLDHLVRHPDGPTCPCNLHPLCRRHHRMKHQTTTAVTRHPDGLTEWRLPTGHRYTRAPAPALSTTTVRPVRRGPGTAPAVHRDLPDHDTAADAITALHHQLHPPTPPDPGPPPF